MWREREAPDDVPGDPEDAAGIGPDRKISGPAQSEADQICYWARVARLSRIAATARREYWAPIRNT